MRYDLAFWGLSCFLLGSAAGAVGMFEFNVHKQSEYLNVTSSVQQKTEPTASNLIRPDMLNVQVSYLEGIVGPAKYILPLDGSDQLRRYDVSGCEMEVGVKSGIVDSYAVDVKPACNFDLQKFANKTPVISSRLNFGDVTDIMQSGLFRSSCIYMCGNAADPTVDFEWSGPHSDSFIQMKFTSVIRSDKAIEAADRWEKAMKKSEGENYVLETLFNCSSKYEQLAEHLFHNVSVNRVEVGYHPVDRDEASYANSCKSKR